MKSIKQAADEFLAVRRVAVTGVSRDRGSHGSNVVYQRLKERGYDVYPVNPNAQEVEGDTCYPDLSSIPGGVEAVVIGTRPDRALRTIEECEALGIEHVWMHRSFGCGSVSPEATARGRASGMTVIDGGCPLMFGATSDRGHRVLRWAFTANGHVPTRV
jgi:predicted CoA-binding protein